MSLSIIQFEAMEQGLGKILELKYGKGKSNTESQITEQNNQGKYGNDGKVLNKDDSAEGLLLMFKKLADRNNNQEEQNKSNKITNVGK